MPRYTMAKNMHLTSLIAVMFGSLVHVRGKPNLETTGHAFSATLSFHKSRNIPEFRILRLKSASKC